MYRKNIIFIILTLLLWIAGITSAVFMFMNSNFDYFNLPLWSIYIVIAVYVILLIAITFVTIRKIKKEKNKYRKYYEI